MPLAVLSALYSAYWRQMARGELEVGYGTKMRYFMGGDLYHSQAHLTMMRSLDQSRTQSGLPYGSLNTREHPIIQVRQVFPPQSDDILRAFYQRIVTATQVLRRQRSFMDPCCQNITANIVIVPPSPKYTNSR